MGDRLGMIREVGAYLCVYASQDDVAVGVGRKHSRLGLTMVVVVAVGLGVTVTPPWLGPSVGIHQGAQRR